MFNFALKLMKHYLYIVIAVIWFLGMMSACSNETDEGSMLDFSEVKGKPIEFDFKGITEEYGITRSTALPTSVTVWVTTDAGEHWYPYIWDNDKKLWKPKSTAVKWTSKTMTIYAAVRGDLTDDTWSNTFTIKSDQRLLENLLKSDFLGARQHATYTSGRISMTLQHRVARLVVLAQVGANDSKANLLTCQTNTSQISMHNAAAVAGTAVYPITGTISCGNNNVDVLANVQSTETEGEEEITHFSKEDPQYYDVFNLYKDNNIVPTEIDNVSGLDNNRTAVFVAYFLDMGLGKIQPGLKFTYLKNQTYYELAPLITLEQGGIGVEKGRTSCITIFMPALP